MTLDEMKKISEARTKGVWKHDWGNHDIEIPYPNRSESLLARGDDGNYNANLEFAAMAANNWDKMMAVILAVPEVLYIADREQVAFIRLRNALKALEQE